MKNSGESKFQGVALTAGFPGGNGAPGNGRSPAGSRTKVPYSALDNTGVLVLGMHRSGTSAVAGVLQRLGVELGSNLPPPAFDNPKGFYEHLDLKEIHDQLLDLLGSSWDDPSPFPKGWHKDPRVEEFQAGISAVLLRDFADKPLWGVKDPRLCRLLPLWLPMLARLGASSKVLLVFRSPAEVVASLGKRNGMPPEQALSLWLLHTLESERETRGYRRAIILYEDLLNDWREEVKLLRETLQISFPVVGDSSAGAVDEFLTLELRHHKEATIEHISAPQKDWAERACEAVREWKRGGRDFITTLDDIAQEFRVAGRAAVSVRQFMEAKQDALAARAETAHDATKAELESKRRELSGAYEMLAQSQEHLEQTRQRLDAGLRELNETRGKLGLTEGELVRARAYLESKRRELSGAYEMLAQSREHLEQTRQTLDARSRELNETRGKLAQTEAELHRARWELGQSQARLDTVRSSTSWKITKPLRGLRNFASSRIAGFDAQPLHDLEPLGPGLWKATGPDPQFLFECEKARAGWFRFQASLEIKGDFAANPMIFLDDGTGFTQENSIAFGPIQSGSLDCRLFFPPGTRALRFDPAEFPCEFKLERIALEPLDDETTASRPAKESSHE